MLRQQPILNRSQAAIDQGEREITSTPSQYSTPIYYTHAPNHQVLPGEEPNSEIDLDDL